MFEPGSEFGRYRIDGLLGRGGMGVVYRALDRTLGRQVALKVVSGAAGEEEVARLLREARAGASFDHPHAVVVHDVGEIDGVAFVAMELVAGSSLRSFVGDGAVTNEQKVKWLVQIAKALGAAHKAGIIHRDIKPENVIVRTEDSAAKVVDFGIARAPSSGLPSGDATTQDANLGTLTQGTAMIGTPLYMAPEALRAEAVDARADQFAWGVVAYELLSGRYPWRVESIVQLAATIASTRPPPLRDTSAEVEPHVEEVVLRAISPDRADRFPTMEAAARALEQARPVPAAEPLPKGTGPAVVRSRWWVLPAVVGAVVALATVVSSRGRSPAVEASASASAVIAPSEALPATAPVSAVVAAPTASFGILEAPLPETRSDALEAYRSALSLMRKASWVQAMVQLGRAISLDPDLGAAHLRRVLSAMQVPGGDAARTAFREAQRTSDRMSARDKSLLDAIRPVFADPPDSAKVAERLVALADASPGDAELSLIAASHAFRIGDFDKVVRFADRALAVDPGYLYALVTRALGLAAKGEWDAADAALARCLELDQSATDCRIERGNLAALRGRCTEAEVHARQVLGEQPGDRSATMLLANARFARGDEDEAVVRIIETLSTGLPPDAIRFHQARLKAGLAVLRGRFADAGRIASTGAPAELRDRNVQDSLALTKTLALVEGGDARAARAFAREYLPVAGTMIAPALDVTPVLRGVAGHEQPTPAKPFRDVYLPFLAWALWAWPYSVDEASARRMVEAWPREAPRNMLLRSSALYAFEGRVLWLAGRASEAKPSLEAAARSCHILDEPFASTWAHLWMGEVREAEKDVSGACEEYAVVVRRWGHVEKSPSAAKAKKARERLRCP